MYAVNSFHEKMAQIYLSITLKIPNAEKLGYLKLNILNKLQFRNNTILPHKI